MPEFAIVILAAGAATRMGRPKQLLDYGGSPLVRHAAQTALNAGCGPAVVVGGAYRLETPLAGLAVTITNNLRWEEGMGASIHCGLQQIAEWPVDGVIITLADQPFLDAATYHKLVNLHRLTGQPIVASRYSGTLGVPILVANSQLDGLRALPPGQGCKGFIESNRKLVASLYCPEAATDIDTPAEYQQLKALIHVTC